MLLTDLLYQIPCAPLNCLARILDATHDNVGQNAVSGITLHQPRRASLPLALGPAPAEPLKMIDNLLIVNAFHCIFRLS